MFAAPVRAGGPFGRPLGSMSRTGAQERTPEGDRPAGRGRAANERVRARQLARLGALFAGFAHEIRNPLSTIGLNLQLVEEDLGAAKDPREERILRRITVVEAEVKRLQSILEQFLGYVRVPDLQLAPVVIDRLLREIVEFEQPETDQKGVSLRLMTDDTAGQVELDANQFRAVIVNLVRNALDACRPGDQILLSSRRNGGDGNEVVVQVTDTGVGMTADVLEKAFTPYFSTKKTGTGLGLPTARRIIEQHGGVLELQSDPERGTQFTIRLPAAGDEARGTA